MACSSTEVSKMTMIEQSVVRTYNFSVIDVGLNPAHATNNNRRIIWKNIVLNHNSSHEACSSTEASKMAVISNSYQDM